MASVPEKTTSVMTQVETVDEAVKTCFHRLEVLEKNLRLKHLSTERREALEKEILTVKNTLVQHERDLMRLRRENSKTFMIAVAIMFFAFLAFGLYAMIYHG